MKFVKSLPLCELREGERLFKSLQILIGTTGSSCWKTLANRLKSLYYYRVKGHKMYLCPKFEYCKTIRI